MVWKSTSGPSELTRNTSSKTEGAVETTSAPALMPACLFVRKIFLREDKLRTGRTSVRDYDVQLSRLLEDKACGSLVIFFIGRRQLDDEYSLAVLVGKGLKLFSVFDVSNTGEDDCVGPRHDRLDKA